MSLFCSLKRVLATVGILLIFLSTVLGDEEVIKTKFGMVRGKLQPYRDTHVYSYLGIPYATPPIGKNRFKMAQEAEPWEGVLDAKNFSPPCPQYFLTTPPPYDDLPGHSENCLYLNIWVPSPLKKGRAVYFFMHSGAYTIGSSRLRIYDGQALAANGDIIVVNINYRLNALGFLYSGTDDAPGNMGFYDALLALKWVNENIEAFGGDPKNLTIGGHSAGAKISSYFSVSPLTKGLFHRIIIESGTFISESDGTESNLKLGQKVAEHFGCANATTSLSAMPNIVVDCLRSVDADHLVRVAVELSSSSGSFKLVYGDPILGSDPHQKLKNGKFHDVDVLIGDLSEDNAFVLTANHLDTFDYFGRNNTMFNKSFAEALLVQDVYPGVPFKDRLFRYYFGDVDDSNEPEIRHRVLHAYTDFLILCPSIYYAEKLSQRDNVFYYFFKKRPSVTKYAPWMGVVHCDELYFVFGLPTINPELYTEEEKQLSFEMMRLWSNFIKTGRPDDQWPHFDTKSRTARILHNPGKQIYKEAPHLEACNILRPHFSSSGADDIH